MKKKFIPLYLIISIALFLVGAIVSSNVPAFQSLFSGTTLYTPAMVETIKQDSYNQGVVDKERLMIEISDYKLSLEKITKERNNLQTELETERRDNSIKTDKITNLEKSIQEKDEIISDLNYRVSYLEELIEAYENPNKYKVSYKSKDTAVDVQLVSENDYSITPEDPQLESYLFQGWSLDGKTIIDTSSHPITEDTTFLAVYTNVPGVYSLTTRQMTMTWQELIDNGYITVDSNGALNSDYSKLKTISGALILDSSITSIGSNVFRTCILEEIILGQNVTSIDSYAFYNSALTKMLVPDSVITIASNAFASCENLKEVKLSNVLNSLPSGLFAGCHMLTKINIPESVETISYACFSSCYSLSNVVIPSNVTRLSACAFAHCTNLKSIYIPSSVVTMDPEGVVGQSMFIGCSADLVVYCEAIDEPSGWTEYWNNYDETNKLSVKYGYTYEEYLAEISA